MLRNGWYDEWMCAGTDEGKGGGHSSLGDTGDGAHAASREGRDICPGLSGLSAGDQQEGVSVLSAFIR